MNRRIDWTRTDGRSSRVTVTEDVEVSPLALSAANYSACYGTPLWNYMAQGDVGSVGAGHQNAAAGDPIFEGLFDGPVAGWPAYMSPVRSSIFDGIFGRGIFGGII